jgi:hypothetical protein
MRRLGFLGEFDTEFPKKLELTMRVRRHGEEGRGIYDDNIRNDEGLPAIGFRRSFSNFIEISLRDEFWHDLPSLV